jgi:hypothetical protein
MHQAPKREKQLDMFHALSSCPKAATPALSSVPAAPPLESCEDGSE